MRRLSALADRIIAKFPRRRTEIRAPSPYHVWPIRDGATSAERAGIFLRRQVARHEGRGARVLCGSQLPKTFDPSVDAGEVALYRFRDCVLCGHNLAIFNRAGQLDVFGTYLNTVDRIPEHYFRDDLRESLVATDQWVTVRGSERWVLIANHTWESYFHWMVDCLPSAAFALRHLGPDTVRLVTPPLPSFAAETLSWLGVRVDQIHFLEDVPQYFEELYFPESLDGRIHCFHPRMGEVLSEIAGLRGERPAPRDLLYISRAHASRRRLVNEAELEEAMRGLGFTVVSPGAHSVAEQRRLFASARLVVGPHGAGLTNLMFMHPGTALVELHYPGYLNTCYYRLAQVMNVRYHTFLGVGEGEGRHTYRWWVDSHQLVAALSPLVAEAPRRALRGALREREGNVPPAERRVNRPFIRQES